MTYLGLSVIIISIFGVTLLAAKSETGFKEETRKVKFYNYHSNKYGYEITYPFNMYLSVDERIGRAKEAMKVPVEDLKNILISRNSPQQKRCDFNGLDCELAVTPYGDGTNVGWHDALEYIERFRNSAEITDKAKTKLQNTNINQYNAEIFVREMSLDYFRAYTYIKCEESKTFFEFTASRKYNNVFSNFQKLRTRKLSIDSLYNSEQLMIINSFKCPKANFFFKKNK